MRKYYNLVSNKYLQYSNLTETEKEVAITLLTSLSYKKIAKYRYVSVPTIKSHIRNIFKKLGVKTRQEFVCRVLKEVFNIEFEFIYY